LSETLFSMDARVMSALARVFDALLPAHDDCGQRALGALAFTGTAGSRKSHGTDFIWP
jgi:hypothetical protein